MYLKQLGVLVKSGKERNVMWGIHIRVPGSIPNTMHACIHTYIHPAHMCSWLKGRELIDYIIRILSLMQCSTQCIIERAKMGCE